MMINFVCMAIIINVLAALQAKKFFTLLHEVMYSIRRLGNFLSHIFNDIILYLFIADPFYFNII